MLIPVSLTDWARVVFKLAGAVVFMLAPRVVQVDEMRLGKFVDRLLLPKIV